MSEIGPIRTTNSRVGLMLGIGAAVAVAVVGVIVLLNLRHTNQTASSIAVPSTGPTNSTPTLNSRDFDIIMVSALGSIPAWISCICAIDARRRTQKLLEIPIPQLDPNDQSPYGIASSGHQGAPMEDDELPGGAQFEQANHLIGGSVRRGARIANERRRRTSSAYSPASTHGPLDRTADSASGSTTTFWHGTTRMS